MKIYLVGGAVRDGLLGLKVTERDWVVEGATADELVALGFRPVGKDFPVFLHPETKEEYALARTERKTAPGYRGFVVHADSDVPLEQDLLRRDLTVNAMALDDSGTLIDPYGGFDDLKQRVLRHVSPAFVEDPLRILRVARFYARYAVLGFRIADETLELMRRMVDAGEVVALVPERVWAELVKALREQRPSAFFQALQDCGALVPLFPEIAALFGVPQPPEHHPEVDTGVHTLLVLDQAARLSDDPLVRFAALTHDLGKALTPPGILPRHHGHEAAGIPVLRSLCERLRAPREFVRLAEQVMREHGLCHKLETLRPATIVDLIGRLNGFHRGVSLRPFVLACEADARGRTGFEDRPYPQGALLITLQAAAQAVSSNALKERGLTGSAFGEALRELRIAAVRRALDGREA